MTVLIFLVKFCPAIKYLAQIWPTSFESWNEAADWMAGKSVASLLLYQEAITHG